MSDDDPHPRLRGRTRTGQFQKGFSGNRRGRPLKARSTRAVIQEMLESKVSLTVDGKIAKMSVVEAMAARMKKEALTGSLRALERGLMVAERYSLQDAPVSQPTEDLSLLTDEELDQLYNLVAKTQIKPKGSVQTAEGWDEPQGDDEDDEA
jgi:hypothetical protein